MAFTNRVRATLPFISTISAASAGTATANNPKEGVSALLNATTTFTFDTTGALAPSPTIRNGVLRLKATSAGTGPGQITAIVFTATDGVTTVSIYEGAENLEAGDLPDLTLPFNLDIAANSFAVAVTCANIANGDYTLDIELAGCP